MAGFVGGGPGRYYAGVITAVDAAAGTVTVRIADEPDTEGTPAETIATGTGAVNDKVTVFVQPSGRVTLLKG